VSNEIALETILHNQMSQVIAEAGKTTGEYGSKTAWNLAREVITTMWENTQDRAIAMERIESFIEQVNFHTR
jgi:predicted hydrocarbon binding protein